MRRLRLVSVGVGIFYIVAAASCGTAESPAAPTGAAVAGPAQATATITGIITGQVPAGTKAGSNTAPLAGATVEVVEGPGAGTVVTTDQSGAFTLSVPPGTLRLRVSRSSFQTWESATLTAVDKQSASIQTVVLAVAPWALSGEVTDNLGRPFAGVEIRVESQDAYNTPFGTVTTDATGRYRLTSAKPHFAFVSLYVSGTGVDPLVNVRVDCCNDAGDTVHDMRLPRIMSVRINGPMTVRVGETVELPAATITYDDGTLRNVYLLMTSSDPDVLTTGRGNPGFTIQARREGHAIVSVDFRRIPATLAVRVER